ncbi:MAG: hypothetical protein K6E50_03460 [Lachnospiraceae bacterium]|nr:hypothetical protein [Lachnospiraceae bacterium]
MKKNVCRTAGVLILAALLCACASEGNAPKENVTAESTSGDAAITSAWELEEFTVNGETTKAEDLLSDVREKAPTFSCTDGSSCVVSNNGKDHEGVLEKTDDTHYLIRFDDTDQTMDAVIEGDKLTLTNNKGTVTMVFRAE